MSELLKSRVVATPDTLINLIDGESVLLNLKSERYYGLDRVGTRMWVLLTTSDSVQDAYEKLLDEYDVDSEVLRRDLIDLVDKLVGKGMLEVNAQ